VELNYQRIVFFYFLEIKLE